MVIGTAAYCGSGQDTLADTICSMYGMVKYSMGDMVRKLAAEQGKQQDRSTLRAIRRECDKLYGRMYFPRMLVDEIMESGNKDCMITGLRTMEEYQLFRRVFDFHFIFLNAQENIRLMRMLQRKEEKDENTIEALRKQMEAECALFDYEELEDIADLQFDFSMNISSYNAHKETIVAEIMKKLGVFSSEDERSA